MEEEAWPDIELGHDLRKVSVNSLIGLMAVESNSLKFPLGCEKHSAGRVGVHGEI